MYFLDLGFLGFVPAWLCLYWLARGRLRDAVLLLGSVGWLAWFSPATVVALGALTLAVHGFGWLAGRQRAAGRIAPAARTAWLGVVVLVVVATFLRLRAHLFAHLGLAGSPIADELFQWLGFSYFLLKGSHVLFGIARGIVPRPSLVGLLQYVLFLPTLTSGPIYRAPAFGEQLARTRRLTWDHVQDGFLRALHGIAKKVIAVPFANAIFGALHARGLAFQPAAFLALYVTLYFDFSGYSDIAIGLGRLLDFEVPENFKHPFTATTLTQFWRNWHATLGDWVRENVFIPMGGVRASGWHLSAIVATSMLVVGVWHGYSLVFLGWGAYHASLLLLENWLGVKPLRPHRTPRWRLWSRYALIQAAIIGGMFAFLKALP